RERAEYHADPGVSPSFQREEREDRREAERRRDERGPGSQELDLPETTQGSIGGRTARGNIGGSGCEGGRALRHWPFPEPAGLKRLSLHAGGSERGGPEGLVLGPRDDVVLQGTGQVAEVVAVARDADDEVAVPLGVRLRRSQGGRGDDVELDVMSPQSKIRTDQVPHLVESRIPFEQLGRELLVQQGPPGTRMVHLGGGLDDCGGTVAVRALDRRDAVREGLSRTVFVGSRGGH